MPRLQFDGASRGPAARSAPGPVRSLHREIWLGVVLACSGFFAVTGWVSYSARHRTVEAAEATTQNFAHILKEHAERTIQSVDVLLKVTALELGPDHRSVVRRSAATSALAALSAGNPHLLSIKLLDPGANETGFEFVRNRAPAEDGVDGDALRAHAADPARGLHVSAPFRDEAAGTWLIGVSRRINAREGVPGNVVVARVSLEPVQRFLDRIDLGEGGSITWIRADGVVLARRPFDPANLGRDISATDRFRKVLVTDPQSAYETVAANDGILRIFSSRRLDGIPLFVTVGLDKDRVLARWREEARWTLLFAGAAAALFVGLGGWLAREARRRHAAERRLVRTEQRVNEALAAGRMFTWELDPGTGFITRSANAADLIGVGSGRFDQILDRIHPDDRDRARRATGDSARGLISQVEFRYRHPDGSEMWLEVRAHELRDDEGGRRLVGMTFDVSERKRAEEEVWRAAHHDPLTGLPNRTLFYRRFEEALAEAEATGRAMGLLLVDLDNFKDVNDTFGHDAGDAVLKHAADRLGGAIGTSGVVARLGGDEFAVLLPGADHPDAILATAREVYQALGQVLTYRHQAFACRASIGVVVHPDHARTLPELMKAADLALYEAKSQGRNRVAVFSPDLRRRLDERIWVSAQMRGALEAGQIVPFYQPKVCLATGRVTGFEALARWLHPEQGLLTPAVFGTAFDDPDLSVLIGRRMLEGIAADMSAWLAAGLEFGTVALNLATAEFAGDGPLERILEELARRGVPPQRLEIEVTETVFLGARVEGVSRTLNAMNRAGIAIALDDFGTGYASLTHLKQFPVDTLKIDRSFVRDLGTDPDSAAIASGVIGLGRSLGMTVVGEGVETADQARLLTQLGCAIGQGYLFSKPMAGSRVPHFLREGGPAAALGGARAPLRRQSA